MWIKYLFFIVEWFEFFFFVAAKPHWVQLIKDVDSDLELKDELHTSFTHLSRLRARAVPRSDGCILAAGISAQLQSQVPDSQSTVLTTLPPGVPWVTNTFLEWTPKQL